MDVAAFLARHPPFDQLSAQDLAEMARSVRIEFFPQGTTILEQSGGAVEFLYVVRSGAVEILENDRLVDLAGEGETFGGLSLISGEGPIATVRAHEDTLCYLVEAEAASRALATGAGLSILVSTLRRRAASGDRVGKETDIEQRRVGSLIRRPPVTFAPDGTVAEAAAHMARERVSSILIPLKDGWGIVTDRDLRSRVLAEGRSPQTHVTEVMSSPVRTISPDTMAGEALLAMLEEGFHHLPVADGSGALRGVVTDTDLMGLARESPFAMKSAIERSADEAEAVSMARRLPEVASALVDASVDPVDIGHIVGVTIDSLTKRLIDLAIGRLGEPPVPWAWLALGSEARHEQALMTDQDHALAYDPQGANESELDPYFAALAEAVTAGLEAAGIPRCKGDAMATHPALRRSVKGWMEAFHAWMSDPGLEGSVLTSIVFDYRRIAGPLDVEASLDEQIRAVPARYPEFLRHLARRALDYKPPTGFFRDFVVEAHGEHAGRLDVKHGGILIIANMARAWAIREGRTEKGTLRRLAVASASGQITAEARQALEEAFKLLWQVRLEHQATQVRAGERPDDFVDPRTLGPIARRGLKEAFRIIAGEQRGLSADLGLT